MANNRIFYPVHMVAIKDEDGDINFAVEDAVHGVQSMAMTTNFNVDQTNELGTQTIYENVEGTPDVEVSVSKVLDGHPTPFLLSTQSSEHPTLISRSAVRCTIGAAIYPDTASHCSGEPETAVAISGAYVDSVSYNFNTDSNFNEDSTYVANDKLWWKASLGVGGGTPGCNLDGDSKTGLPPIQFNAAIPLVDKPLAEGGIARGQDFDFTVNTGASPVGQPVINGEDSNGAINHPDTTVMPCEIAGFAADGTNPTGVGGQYGAHVSSFTASVSLGREDVLELGRRGPYFRAATFPVEVTSELQATAAEGDLVSALDGGIYGTGLGKCASAGTNTKDRTIRVVLCEGLRLYLGVRNRLQSVGYSGGDADGGNVTISYTYTNYNDFTVMHENDPAYDFGGPVGGGSGVFQWEDRYQYCIEK